jgi:hypothetical protein
VDCGAVLCVIKKPHERGGHSPLWAAVPGKKIYGDNFCMQFHWIFLITAHGLNRTKDLNIRGSYLGRDKHNLKKSPDQL